MDVKVYKLKYKVQTQTMLVCEKS